jgi:hypothetical protein
MAWLRGSVNAFDSVMRRLRGRRIVIVDARTPMNYAILAPIVRELERDQRIVVLTTAERPHDFAWSMRSELRSRIYPRRTMHWRRVDLCITADPWDPIRLRRCHRRANFFHGVAGKYDLDSPAGLPTGFEEYDRIAFINTDRMTRYLDKGLVDRQAAILVGYPKVDALVNGAYDAAAVRAELQLDSERPTAIYAPTWSPASSLNVAGEGIVRSLIESGFNVIVKLHDRSLDPTRLKFSGGVDWRTRFAAMHVPERMAFVEAADASPLLAASDVMVTDHSSIGFEFCLLDRPLIVFDAPDLPREARINPEKIAQLRSAACVVRDARDVGPAALDEVAHPERRGSARRAVARDLFYEPGSATTRAMQMLYDLLELQPSTDMLRAQPIRANVPASLSS